VGSRQIDQDIALTRYPLVELGDHLLHGGLAPPQLDDRIHQVIDTAQVLDAEGMGDAFVGKQLAAAALGAEAEVTGIRAVHRDSQPQREIALQLGGVVGDQVRPIGVGWAATAPAVRGAASATGVRSHHRARGR
jgi:hypothetical protein